MPFSSYRNLRSRAAATFVCTIAAVSPAAFAGNLLYDNGVGGATGIGDTFFSDADFPQFVADDVALAAPASITGVEWTGTYIGGGAAAPGADDFTISIFADTGGTGPGAELFSFHLGDAVNRTDTGIDLHLADVYEYSAAINFELPANTTIWISIAANSVGDAHDFSWGALIGPGNAFGGPSPADTGWFAQQLDIAMDFRLIGETIPAPGALALFGLVGLVCTRRRA